MLESSEHVSCRKEVIEFLFSQRAIRDAGDTLEEFFPQSTKSGR
jgi:hypothetical protein